MNSQEPANPVSIKSEIQSSARAAAPLRPSLKSAVFCASRSAIMPVLLGLLGVMLAMVASHAEQAGEVPLLDKEQFIQQLGDGIYGKVLDISLDADADPPVYRVKVLSESGVVRVLSFDAQSGQRSEP